MWFSFNGFPVIASEEKQLMNIPKRIRLWKFNLKLLKVKYSSRFFLIELMQELKVEGFTHVKSRQNSEALLNKLS